jgi:hypothetical protein
VIVRGWRSATFPKKRVAACAVKPVANLGMESAADRLRQWQEFTASEVCDLYLEIGTAFTEAEGYRANATAIKIIRMPAMTGARRNEIAAVRS